MFYHNNIDVLKERIADIMIYKQSSGYNQQKTIGNYRNELLLRIEKDHSASDITYVIGKLEEADPSKKKAFVIQLLKWYLSGSMRFIEDSYKATEPLLLYAKFRNRGLTPLNQMTFGELLDLGDELSDTKSNTEMNKEEEQQFYLYGEAELITDTPEWKVVIPRTEEAAIYFGRNTQWCTSATNDNAFYEYNNDGPLYIILFKKENKRYQLHFQSGQYMDERDEYISLEEGKRIFDGPMKQYQKIAVQQDGGAIEYIDNPSEELQKLAVQQDGSSIEYIDNPSEELQKLAVQQDGFAIYSIKNPSEEIKRLAVQQDGFAIRHITNPSDEVQEMAVRQNGDAILWIKNPSKEIEVLSILCSRHMKNK